MASNILKGSYKIHTITTLSQTVKVVKLQMPILYLLTVIKWLDEVLFLFRNNSLITVAIFLGIQLNMYVCTKYKHVDEHYHCQKEAKDTTEYISHASYCISNSAPTIYWTSGWEPIEYSIVNCSL